jgi:hypothetical protein
VIVPKLFDSRRSSKKLFFFASQEYTDYDGQVHSNDAAEAARADDAAGLLRRHSFPPQLDPGRSGGRGRFSLEKATASGGRRIHIIDNRR